MDKKEMVVDYHTIDKRTGLKIHFLGCTRGDLLLMEYSAGELTPVEYIHFLLCKELWPDQSAVLN